MRGPSTYHTNCQGRGNLGLTGDSILKLSVPADGGQVICIDVGGTAIKAGRFTLDKQLSESYRAKTVHVNRQSVIDQLVEVVEILTVPSIEHCAVVVGVPGFVSDGIVIDAPNLPDWHQVPLYGELSRRLAVPVAIENDVNLATLGETFFGVARGYRNVVFLNIGTGVGAGIIINQKLFRGASCAAGEIGFLVPGIKELHESFENVGAFEYAVAMQYLARYMQQNDEKTTASPAEIINAARAGSNEAMDALTRWADYLSVGLIALSAVLNPEIIVIGGSGCKAFELVKDRVVRHVQNHSPVPPIVACTELGEQAALWGGANIGLELLLHS